MDHGTKPRRSLGGLSDGQPHIGDFEFCSRFDQGFGNYAFRFINFQDIVPRVPLRIMNYYEVGQFFYFNENKYDPSTTWGEILLHNIGNTIQEIVSMNDIKDQYMENYLAKLKSLAESSGCHDM